VSVKKGKVLIIALSLALLASFAALYIVPAEQSSGATMDIHDLLYGVNHLNDEYLPTATIELYSSTPDVSIFDGDDMGILVTISDGDLLNPGPLIRILDGNNGTFIFRNLTFSANEAISIENGGGADKIVFENVTFTGDRFMVTIDTAGTELIVDSCYFAPSTNSNLDINVSGGTLELKKTSLYSWDCGVVFSTEEHILIEDCYFEAEKTAVYFNGDGKADITIRDCIILGRQGFYLVDVRFNELLGADRSFVEVLRTEFTPANYTHGSGPAFKVSGYGRGDVVIWQCQFESLAYAGPVVCIDLDQHTTYMIYDTTFCYNRGRLTPMPGESNPVIYLKAASGTISNSTFYENKVEEGDQPVGCVYIDNPDMSVSYVDVINCTFYENYYLASPESIPASMQRSDGSTVRLLNSILVTDNANTGHPGDSTMIGHPLTNLGGNLDQVGGAQYIFAVGGWGGNNGYVIGCSIREPVGLFTLYILPGGLADGEGTESSSVPEKDQRGKVRNGSPDIGSVSVDSAVFHSTNGRWVPMTSFGNSTAEPFFFSNAEGASYFDMHATAENEVGKILLPNDYYPDILSDYGTGLLFLGWTTSGLGPELPEWKYVNLGGDMLGDFEVDGEYYAVWGTEYVIVYFPGFDIEPVVKKWGEPAPEFSTPGAYLAEWMMDGGAVWYPSTPLTGNLILYGSWLSEPPVFTVTVEFRNGSQTNSVSIPMGTAVSKPADPVREGYLFLGWFTAQQGGAEWNFNDDILEDLVLYAHWVELFTVTFDPCNGSDPFTIEVEKGKPSPVPRVIPTLEDHAFTGWFTAAEGGVQWDFDTPITENLVLYAQWEEADENSIILYPRNGDPPIIIKLGPDGRLPTLQDPTKTGFKFLGWFTDEEGGTKWDGGALQPGTRLYAHWEETGGGGLIEIEDGVLIAAVVASLFASVGVVPLAMSGATNISTQVATANVFQQGQQNLSQERSAEEKNRRTVIFDPQNGRSSWASSVMGGRQVSRPSDPKAPGGMRFSHWSESPGGPPFSFLTPINKTTHLYAQYVKKD